MNKSDLRKKYKALRRDLSSENLDDYSIAIANQVLKLPIWEHAFYHVFLSIEEHKEINTDYILNILAGKDKNIVIQVEETKDGKNSYSIVLTSVQNPAGKTRNSFMSNYLDSSNKTWTNTEGFAHSVGVEQVKAIKKVGKDLNLYLPLDGSSNVGRNWKETH